MRTLSLVPLLILFAAVNVRAQCDPALIVPSDGTAIATPVIMSEINPGVGGYIEFFNPGIAAVNLTGWWLCSPFSYAALSATIPAGSYKTVAWPANFFDTDAGGEVMLYKTGNFGTSADIVDYVCWGASNQFRYGQAVSVGKWIGACAPALVGGAIHRLTNTTGTDASSYDVTSAPSPMNCTPAVTGIESTPSFPSIKVSIGPNPFSALATIQFTLSSAAAVKVSVYSVTGARVRQFDTSNYSGGTGRVLWDGKDDAGRALPSGTYMVRVSANSSAATQRVTIIR